MEQRPQSMTEEQIRAATVGEPRVHGAPIELVDYDPAWPELFAREAQQIAAALGARALGIEHVGSTAVPGLAAKPIIDLVLVVTDSADEETYAPALESAGYALRIREPAWYEHRMFDGSNQADRELYERTKRELAAREWRYVQNYADAKGAVVEEIITRARAEEGG